MKMIPRYLPLILSLFSFAALSGLSAQQAGTSPVKIYIMVGQSNMVGHGDMSPVGTQGTLEYIVANNPGSPGKYDFVSDGVGGWVVRDDVWFIDESKVTTGLTTGLGGNTGKIGPELGFGHVIGDYHAEQVFIIKASWGGKSLAVDFRPPSSGGDIGYYYKLMTGVIDDAVANLGTYFPDYDGQGYEFAGFCWHQGYNDRVIGNLDAEYEVNMANFINDIRDYLDVPKLPFVIATTGMGGGTETTLVEDAQMEMANATSYPEFAGNVSVIDTRNTTYLGESYWQEVANSPANEGHHWNRNAMTYLHIGMAMGDAMTALPGPECPSRLAATGDASGVTLTWQNGSEAPDSVQVLRNGVEIAAVAPVVPASFVDTAAEPGVLNYVFNFDMPTATCDPLTVTLDAGITDLIGYRVATGVALEWMNNLGYTNIQVRRNGDLIDTIAGTATTYTDTTVASTGSFTYSVVPTNGSAAETEVIVGLGPPSAGDAVIYEPFDYPVGGLNGQSGASETGLEGSWNAHSTALLQSGSLNYGTLPTFGASIGNLTAAQNRRGGARAISASALSGLLNDGETLWFSVVMGFGTGVNGTNARLAFSLGTTGFNGGNFSYVLEELGATGLGVTMGNGGKIFATEFRDGSVGGTSGFTDNVFGNVPSSPAVVGAGARALVVGKFTWGATQDTLEIYLPDENLNLGSVVSTLTLDDANPDANFHSVDQSGYDTISFKRGDVVTMDEIRFGASYDSVIGKVSFASWIAGYSGLGSETGFDDDPDKDNLKNGLENYFGTHPGTFNAGLNVLQLSGGTFTFSHPISDTPADDITASYKWSTDLSTFHDSGATVNDTTVSFVPGSPSGGMVDVAANIFGIVPDKIFVRLEVLQLP